MIRMILYLGVIVGALYWYAENYGLAAGYAPFTPVFYWKHTGEAVYEMRVTGVSDLIKVMVSGELQEGTFQVEVRKGGRVVASPVTYQGKFNGELKYPTPDAGNYQLRFSTNGAKGYVKFDWVSTKFE